MFNYNLVVLKGNTEVRRYELEQGESKKGTFKTLSAKTGLAAIPFGKLYVSESELMAPPKTNKKS